MRGAVTLVLGFAAGAILGCVTDAAILTAMRVHPYPDLFVFIIVGFARGKLAPVTALYALVPLLLAWAALGRATLRAACFFDAGADP